MSVSWRQDCSDGSCDGGKKSLKVEFEMGPRHTLPCTLENLSQVSFLHYGKVAGNLELCIGDSPTVANPGYNVIQFAPGEKINIVQGFSPEARDAVLQLMKVITGQSFTIGFEDERHIIFWRTDLAGQIAAFEKQHSQEE